MGIQKSNKQLQVEVRDDEAREPSVDKNKNRTAVQDRGTNGHTTPAATKEAGGEPHVPKGTSPPATIATQHTISPFAFIKRFAEDMDRLFEESEIYHGARMPRLLSRGLEMFRREAGPVPVDWSPQIDVKERDGKFIVRADLLHDPWPEGRVDASQPAGLRRSGRGGSPRPVGERHRYRALPGVA